MKPVADTQYLMKRGQSWTYFRRVPKRLIPMLGRRFFKKALGVTDLASAQKLRNIENVRVDALMAAAESGKLITGDTGMAEPTVSLSVLTEHVRESVERLDKRFAQRLAVDPPADKEELKDLRDQADHDLGILTNPSDPRRDEWVGSASDKILDHSGSSLTDKEVVSQFAEVVRRGLIELQHRKLDRYDDRHDRPFHDALFDRARPPDATFGELAAIFLAEREEEYRLNNVNQKRVDKVRAEVAILIDILGKVRPLHEIDDDAVQKVRSLLSRMPTNKNKHYPKLTVEQAIARAEKDGRPALSVITQTGYLSTLKDILKVGVRKRLMLHNPAEDVRPLKKDGTAPEDRRRPLDDAQLKGFFEGEFYRSCAVDAGKPYSKPDRVWRFWIPLVVLFTGARPNEIAQLHIADVKQTPKGTWFLHLVADDPEDGKTLKTRPSRRRVPLHPELMRMGFLALVQERAKHVKKNGPRLFYELKPDKYGNFASYALRRFRDDFMPAEIDLGDRQVFYSLRHNVRDALRRANAPDETLRAITGWAPHDKAVSDHYGDPGNPDFHAKWVEKIAYPGLDLSFLYRAGEKS